MLVTSAIIFLVLFCFQKILLNNPVPPAPGTATGFGVQVAVEFQEVAAGHFVEEVD